MPLNAELQAIVFALNTTDAPLSTHCCRVGSVAMRLGHLAGIDRGDIELLGQAALLHDIGKVGVAEGILYKPGPLNAIEWEAMRRHPEIGARIVRAWDLPLAKRLAELVYSHHEHIDGSGYPEGLKGSKIPLLARIVAVADGFDALREKRAYRPALPHAQVMDILRADRSRKFDPDVLELLERIPLD